MKKKPNDSFKKFKKLTKQIIQVPKKDLDKKEKEYKQKKKDKIVKA